MTDAPNVWLPSHVDELQEMIAKAHKENISCVSVQHAILLQEYPITLATTINSQQLSKIGLTLSRSRSRVIILPHRRPSFSC